MSELNLYKPKQETKKLPAEFMMNEFMNQQLTTLDKTNIPEGSGDATAVVEGSIPSTQENNLNKQGGKKNDDANAKTN